MDERPDPAEVTHPIARLGTWLGPAAFVACLLIPLPTLAVEGKDVLATEPIHVVLGLIAWMATWWMTEAIPLAVTSLLPLVVLPVAGVSSAKSVALTYFDDTIALFLGGFCLALALERSGLHRRIALGVLRVFGTRPRGMVFGFLVSGALISMWVSNTATSLMLLPVALTTVAAVAGADPARRTAEERSFAAACVLGVAYGASIGGMGTLVGTPPNMIMKGVYDRQIATAGGHPLTFGEWILVGTPVVLVLIPVTWIVLTRGTLKVPARFARLEGGRGPLIEGLGRWRRAEKVVCGVFLATAFAWITRQGIPIGDGYLPLTGWDEHFRFGAKESFITDATIGVLATLVLFLVPARGLEGGRILTWDHIHAHVPWGSLLLFGGGFSLAQSFGTSGLNEYLKAAFAGLQGLSAVLLVGIVVAGITLLSEVASNTATAAMILPLLTAVGVAAGLEPHVLLFAGALAASCGFALPVATPPNLLAYGTGQVTTGQMVRAGIVLDAIGIAVVTAVTLLLTPLLVG